MRPDPRPSFPSGSLILLAGLLLIAASLRAPVTGVAPVLSQIALDFQLSPGMAGALTTLPLIAFGLVSPLAVWFGQRFGLTRSLFVAMLLLALGIVIRSAGTIPLLYAGTALIGAAIAVGNVLLPGVVKRNFPTRVAAITSATVVTMGIGAAITSVVIVPLEQVFAWQISLGLMAVLPLAAMIVWAAQPGRLRATGLAGPRPAPTTSVWKTPLAWQLTVFMGLNSLLYYTLTSWLPQILAEAGYTALEAGSLHGVMQLAAAVPGIVLGPLVARMRDQRLVAFGTGVTMFAAFAGLLLLPGHALLWITLYGASSGSVILLAMIFMSLRATSAAQTAALSGMAQCIGYLLAAAGPLAAGMVYEQSGTWTSVLLPGLALSAVIAVFGLLAGRERESVRPFAPD